MDASGFSIGALIFTRLPSITPTTPGNPPSALKLSIVSLNWVPAWDQKTILIMGRDKNRFEQARRFL